MLKDIQRKLCPVDVESVARVCRVDNTGDSFPLNEGALAIRRKMTGIDARSELLSRCIEEGKYMPQKTPFKSVDCKESTRGIVTIIS